MSEKSVCADVQSVDAVCVGVVVVVGMGIEQECTGMLSVNTAPRTYRKLCIADGICTGPF